MPKNSLTFVKAKLIQATRDMRSQKLIVRRLTQTEIIPGEVKSGRLNDSLIDSLAADQTLLYKRLIADYNIDEAVATYACL